MDELLSEFLIESTENMSKLDQDLVLIEKDPSNKSVLQNIFRVIHTVKGTCGMLALSRLEKIAHAAEDVLSAMREENLEINSQTIGPVLQAIDIIKSILEYLEGNEKEPEGEDSEVISHLRRLIQGDSAESFASVSSKTNKNLKTEEEKSSQINSEKKASLAEQSLRVHIGILDVLMNLVGELVLNRNQLLQLTRRDEESPYLNPVQQLNRVTSGLQEAVMKTRMQPIGNAWSKLPRIVRDLEQATGKKLELVMIGQETEIDRQILQAIQDPLVHCVRNSADHGIETSEIRIKKGKSPTGQITLKAFHEGGHIIIEIKDDGAGINPEIICQKAIEKGLVTKDVAVHLSENQILKFIFEAGFSTAQKVTEVSGRGVGMDVVKSNIESIGGVVDISSQHEVGTTLRIKIPLTLAIISALLVKAGSGHGSVFAIPQVGVVELVHISESNHHLVDNIQGSKILRLRGKLLPLVDLASVLGIEKIREQKEISLSIVVVQVSEMQFGLVVDEVYDTQEIVVKPVGRLLREVNLFSGSTILGDGRVVIILDIARIAAQAFPKNSLSENEDSNSSQAQSRQNTGGDKTILLVFRPSEHEYFAVPLALVARLEEFSPSQVEKVDGKHVVQYRGSILPLIPCSDQLDRNIDSEKNIAAIVFSDGQRSMGLWVHDFVDITEENLNLETTAAMPGHLGAAIIAGKATELIDAYYFLKLAYPDWFKKHSSVNSSQKVKILFVEDSKFFQNLIKPLLESKGYEVILANDGQDALKLIKQDASFDLILSDIEMPQMSGLEMIKLIRAQTPFQKIPALALTTLSGASDREKGLQAGFDDYLIKFDQDIVLESIQKLLKKNYSYEASLS